MVRDARNPVGAVDRFLIRVQRTDSCWIWIGSITRNGYGTFRDGSGKSSTARRFAYERFVGAIPRGLVIDATCGNRLCVCPEHLRLASWREVGYDKHHRLPTTISRTAEERFWQKVDKSEGCWLWTAATNPKGYGCFAPTPDNQMGAHRFSYMLAKGPIPDGLFVLHRCDVPACVRPDHLFLGTQRENIRVSAIECR